MCWFQGNWQVSHGRESVRRGLHLELVADDVSVDASELFGIQAKEAETPRVLTDAHVAQDEAHDDPSNESGSGGGRSNTTQDRVPSSESAWCREQQLVDKNHRLEFIVESSELTTRERIIREIKIDNKLFFFLQVEWTN